MDPAEIARLVFGYLEKENCDDAHEKFQGTSKHLGERSNVQGDDGLKPNSPILGKSLDDIMLEYFNISELVKQHLENVSPKTSKTSGSLLDKLSHLIDENNSGKSTLSSETSPPENSS